MKKFFGEFKKFITRGNVLDMAVGVIVGGAFTAIVNGVSNFVLKPIINWVLSLILGKDALSEIYTFLTEAYTIDPETGAYVLDEAGNKVIDLANSIYIDWGSLILAVINFIITAFVLFLIVKFINKVKENNEKWSAELKKGKLTKEQRKELKANGVNRRDKQAVKEYFDKKAEEACIAEERAKAEAEEKAKQDRLANPTTEDLLKQIITILDKKGE